MKCCPKCHSIVIQGPKYEHDCYGERLRYTCFRCGYSTTTPTEDARTKVGSHGNQVLSEALRVGTERSAKITHALCGEGGRQP